MSRPIDPTFLEETRRDLIEEGFDEMFVSEMISEMADPSSFEEDED